MARLASFISVVEDALFPRFCVHCFREGSLLCKECFAFWVPSLPPAVCFSCKRPSAHGFTCVSCRSDFLPDSVQSSFVYADPVFRELLHAWKYFYDVTAWELIQRKLLVHLFFLDAFVRFQKIDVITYVPLHDQRLCERGFDQSREIAEFLGSFLDVPVRAACVRTRATGSQVERSIEERVVEMSEAPFVVREDFDSKRCLLVDDVWTTGATASAVVRVLKEQNVKRVHVFSLGRG